MGRSTRASVLFQTGRWLLLVGILLVAGRPTAQAQAPRHVITACAVCPPQDAAAADVDGDGHDDLLLSSDDEIVWYERQDGSFSARRTITTDAGYGITAADLSGNGLPDVVSTDDTAIVWYENRGDGSFSDRRTVATQAERVQGVFPADLNGDGRLDVLALSVSSGHNRIVWYENRGGGRFSAPTEITAPSAASPTVYAPVVHAADLNGDGRPDVLSAKERTVVWYENRGGGRFSGPHTVAGEVGRVQHLRTADLTGTGRPDVLVLTAVGRSPAIKWSANRGGGQFAAYEAVEMGDRRRPEGLVASDLNGDDRPDVLTSYPGGTVAWHANRGGDFSTPTTIATGGRYWEQKQPPVRAVAAGVRGEGGPDVLSIVDDRVAWHENDGEGRFADPRRINERGADEAADVYAADLTENGRPDVLSASPEDNTIAWYKNRGDGFSAATITTAAEGARSVHAADLTGNGRADVLSASGLVGADGATGTVAWYENRGGGQFSTPKTIAATVERGRDVTAADLNEDGRVDVLAASGVLDGNDVAGTVAWYENQGNGRFSARKTLTTEAEVVRSVTAADLTGNGQPDVLTASSVLDRGLFDVGNARPLQGKIAWYKNEGGGQFSKPKTITTDVEDPKSVTAADLTGDGTLDVLSASAQDDKIAWYENQGDGRFSDQKIIDNEDQITPDGNEYVTAADLTGNGRPDVLAASWRDDTVAWYENQGGGQFSEQKTITTAADAPRSVHVVDLNGDGVLDILSASSEDNAIAWYDGRVLTGTPPDE